MRRQTYFAKPGETRAAWRVVDAADIPLGRLASDIAVVLMGKHRPEYTPHVDCGDVVVVTNASRVALTGNKAEQRMRRRYTGYPGGLKAESYGHLRQRSPETLVQEAVRRMLPKNRLGRVMLARLKVYPGAEHPHVSQNPMPLSA
ncbi:MAG TPA: 50S ribosomal protein L13 [Phycisphaerales bacterium]|nr:50S ribosomal protein L13 [Phycisphaerales bacterium]